MSVSSILVILLLPRPPLKVLARGRQIAVKLLNNSLLPAPTPGVVVFTQHLDVLEAAQAAAKNGGVGTTATRDTALQVVRDDLESLRLYVTGVALKNPTQAQQIVESVGMRLRRSGLSAKPPLRAVMGQAAGAIRVSARAASRKKAPVYAWQWSTDGVTWSDLGISTAARTVFDGALPGTRYFFRVRVVSRGVAEPWSDAVSLFAH